MRATRKSAFAALPPTLPSFGETSRRAGQNLLAAALLAAVAFATTIACAADQVSARTKLGTIPEIMPELKLGALQGYLAPKELPNSLALIPPPPEPGSTAFALDVEVAYNTFALRDTPRFVLAEADFELNVPSFVRVFSCALNTQITKDNAPYLYNLLSRSFTDIGLSTYGAKNHYGRTRPFNTITNPWPRPKPAPFLRMILLILPGTPLSAGGMPSSDRAGAGS